MSKITLKAFGCIAVSACIFFTPVYAVPTSIESVVEAEVYHKDVANYFPIGTVYVVSPLNIREGPTTDAAIIRTLDPGEQVNVSNYEGDWANIGDGYCYGPYLATRWNGEMNIHGTSFGSSRFIGYVYDLFQKVPENVLNIVKDYDISICEGKIKCNYSEDDLKAQGRTITSATQHEMQLDSTVETLKQAVCHESGHVYDHYFFFHNMTQPSASKVFMDAFDAEHEIYLDYFDTHKLNVQTPEEYYAESFQAYLLDPENLSQNCPLTYAAVEETLSYL